jgi:hypothetical protein
MSLFDGKSGCKICGKTEAEGCDCWEGFDDFRKAESINQRIAGLIAERDEYKTELDQIKADAAAGRFTVNISNLPKRQPHILRIEDFDDLDEP